MKGFRFIFLALFIGACIDPFTIKIADSEEQLVVEGIITDQPGPYTIKLYKTTSLTNQLNSINWVKGASVSIIDNDGKEAKLSETSVGNYQTDTGFVGVVGKTYFARISTSDKNLYESEPEKLISVGNMKNIYYDFSQNEDPKKTDYLTTSNGFNVYVDGDILPEQQGLTRWRWTGTFEIKTNPEKQTTTQGGTGGSIVVVPTPPKCSGWTYSVRTGLQEVAPCTCCFCWVTQNNDTPILSDQSFTGKNDVKKFKIAFIPANKRYFFQKYRIDVEQMSVSQSVYDFWKKVQIQKQTGSNLFQTPAPQTTGNIKAITSGAVQALGYFGASSIKKGSIIINRTAIPYFVPADTTAMSCAVVYKNSSIVKPSFW